VGQKMGCACKDFMGKASMAFLSGKAIDNQLLRDYLVKHIGMPYIWGGDDPIKGYDCSGFMVEVLKAFGRVPNVYDNTAQGLYEMLKQNPLASFTIGAMVFYGKSTDEITHVGMCLNKWQVIEAGGGGRTTTDVRKAALQNAYIRARPIDYRSDLVSCLYPFTKDL